ncbi:bifunctional DNA primase/polymerase [Streptomyces sp. NPDC054765]
MAAAAPRHLHQSAPPAPDQLLPGLTLPADLDPADIRNGKDVLALLCRLRRAPLLSADPPETFSVHTPSGGLHLWYQVGDGSKWRMDSRGRLGWQVDIRADRSYAVAPGTRTRAGLYTLLGDCRCPCPPARAGAATSPRPCAPNSMPSPPAGPAATTRSTKNAYCLGRLVGAGLLDRAEVHQALTDAAQLPGTRLITTLPHRIAAEHASDPALRTLPAPQEIPPLRYQMSWHPRLDDDPAQRWLRDTVRSILAEPSP